MFKDIYDSLVRTFTPIFVGWVISLFVANGINLDPQFELALTTGLTPAFGFIYYFIIRVLEVYVAPKFGWLLGLAKAPEYPAKPQ